MVSELCEQKDRQQPHLGHTRGIVGRGMQASASLGATGARGRPRVGQPVAKLRDSVPLCCILSCSFSRASMAAIGSSARIKADRLRLIMCSKLRAGRSWAQSRHQCISSARTIMESLTHALTRHHPLQPTTTAALGPFRIPRRDRATSPTKPARADT